MITLGVDPGTAILGFGIISGDRDPSLLHYGAIQTAAELVMPERLRLLYEALTAEVEQFQPDVLAIEQLFFARNVTTALSVGQARGVVLLLAAQHELPVYEYKPNEVKLAVAGYGGADKLQMQNMVAISLQLDEVPQPDDAADALAVALCHVFSNRLSGYTG